MLPSGRLAIQALSAGLASLAHVALIEAGTVFAPAGGALGGAAVGGAAVGGAAVGGAAVGGAAVGGAAVGGAAVAELPLAGLRWARALDRLGWVVGCTGRVTVGTGVALAAAVTSKITLAELSVARVGITLALRAVCVAACVVRRVHARAPFGRRRCASPTRISGP